VAEVTEELLEALAEHQGVREVLVKAADLSLVEPMLLARLATGLEEVGMVYTRLNWCQLRELCTSLVRGEGVRLKRLNLFNNDLGSLDPDLLARAVSRVEEVVLGGNLCPGAPLVTRVQVEALLGALGGRGATLRSLSLAQVPLAPLAPSALAQAVRHLHHLELSTNNLTGPDLRMAPQQAEALCQALVEGGQLRRLELSVTNLSMVGSSLLARAITSLQEVSLMGTRLTTTQCLALFTALTKPCRLRVLRVEEDLSSVPPALLAQAITSLTSTFLLNTKLSPDQATSLFTTLARPSSLTKLEITFADLSPVAPKVLAEALAQVEEVSLVQAGLTAGQVTRLLRRLGKGCRLHTLLIHHADVATVAPKVLARGANSLRSLDLSFSYLTGEQVRALLERSLLRSNLVEVRLWTRRRVEEKGMVEEGLLSRARRVIRRIDLCQV